jgi:hypothetical protein
MFNGKVIDELVQTVEKSEEATFPHPVACPCCRAVKRCNGCGRPASEWHGWETRCTNGRCPECCKKECKHVSF